MSTRRVDTYGHGRDPGQRGQEVCISRPEKHLCQSDGPRDRGSEARTNPGTAQEDRGEPLGKGEKLQTSVCLPFLTAFKCLFCMLYNENNGY